MISKIIEGIERLVEYIPIDSDGADKSNARFASGVSMDSRFAFQVNDVTASFGDIDSQKITVSFRDIVRLLNKFLRNATFEELVASERYRRLQDARNSGLHLKHLLFDFSLAALAGESFDAKLYLAHSLRLLGVHRKLNLVLGLIVNEHSLKEDKDVRELLTLIAMITEPDNIDSYFDADKGYNDRYNTYLKEMQKLGSPFEEMEVKGVCGVRIGKS